MVYREMEKIKLKNKIDALPGVPGVYIFKDSQENVLYVGKAKSLKKRVKSYFNRFLSDKTQAMVSKIVDIEYTLTPSESQAQLLEASLIKDKQPPYNVSLKDDKSFPLIRITAEEFPIVSICRRKSLKKEDKSLYFGPYTNAKLLRQAFKVMRQIFGLRSCKKMLKTSCLYYRLRLCPAPCIGKIDKEAYQEIIQDIELFLDSRYKELLGKLAQRMKRAAEEKRFEDAAKIRDKINALSVIGQAKVAPRSQKDLEDLKELAQLNKLPLRIEAFDISDISGKEATGSMVSFYKAFPDKNNYRHFRIKTVEKIDDYGMLKEIIKRRYSRIIRENLSLPDLILIDGGRSHLLAAEKELKKLGLNIPLVSIAKDKENIYIQNKKNPLKLNQDTPALNLIRRIRDEAHRFAIKYHHLLRRKRIIGR